MISPVESMDLEHIVGSIMTDSGPQPFVLHLKTGKLEVGTYARPDAAQAALSIIHLQRFAQLINEMANVSFAQVRLGQYYCTHCRRWVEATPEQWSLSMCMSCSLDRGSELAERYREEERASTPAPVETLDEAPQADAELGLEEEGTPAPAEAPVDAPQADAEPGTGEEVLLEKAILLAVEAHRGQVDKAGAPYILHPLRMMLKMHTPAEMMAAVLHDVVEDTSWTLKALRRAGFPDEVVEAVAGLTRQAGESYEAFIERAAQHPIACRVKLADLEDNMDLRRLAVLTDKDQARLARYQRAWRRLMNVDFENL